MHSHTSPLSDGSALEVRRTIYRLNDVDFAYNAETPALHNLSISFTEGESVALLGANGSGKSTLLKMLGGLVFAQNGAVEAFGEPLTERKMDNENAAYLFRRKVGFVFQNSEAQLFSSSVREEIAFGPLHLGLERDQIEQRVADIAQLMEIDKLMDRAPFQLSGGEKKRVALGSALAVNPDVLLLDEPTTGLDPKGQRSIIDLLALLRAAGKTLIISTHDLDLVPELAERALILNEEHNLELDLPANQLFDDLSLLVDANLIHSHSHRHGTIIHSHPHFHSGEHEHSHEPPIE